MSPVSARPTQVPTIVFLFSERCPRCAPTLRAVWAWCDEAGVRLRVRKPNTAELAMRGFGFPAVRVPAGAFNNPQEAFLIGDRPTEALTRLRMARILR